jgi:hypothetical protein
MAKSVKPPNKLQLLTKIKLAAMILVHAEAGRSIRSVAENNFHGTTNHSGN